MQKYVFSNMFKNELQILSRVKKSVDHSESFKSNSVILNTPNISNTSNMNNTSDSNSSNSTDSSIVSCESLSDISYDSDDSDGSSENILTINQSQNHQDQVQNQILLNSDNLTTSIDLPDDVFNDLETEYHVVGIIKGSCYLSDTLYWIVEIKDTSELVKIKKNLTGIVGLFRYDSDIEIDINSRVIVSIIYNNRDYCKWKKNKIIELI